MADLTGLSGLVAGDVLEPLEGTLIREYEAEADITKGQAVYLSADEKVSPATSAQSCIGIAIKDASSGDVCSVIVRGRVKVEAGGAITRGTPVYGGDSSARVLAFAGTETAQEYMERTIGFSEQSATAAGDLISILVVK